MGTVNHLTSAVGFWLMGWRAIFRDRKLLALATFPIAVSLSAAVVSLWLLFSQIPTWLQGFQLTYYPLLILAAVALFAGVLYAVYFVHAVISIPFYAAMAERALRMGGAEVEQSSSVTDYAANFLRMLRVSLTKAILFFVLGIGLFILAWIPGLNFLSIAGAMFLLAFDCMDYSFEVKRLGFRSRLRYALGHFSQWLGHALGLGLTLVIPGLTLLVIPGAVVGAALNMKDLK